MKTDIRLTFCRFSFKPYFVWKKDFKEFGWLGLELMIRKVKK